MENPIASWLEFYVINKYMQPGLKGTLGPSNNNEHSIHLSRIKFCLPEWQERLILGLNQSEKKISSSLLVHSWLLKCLTCILFSIQNSGFIRFNDSRKYVFNSL